MLVQGKTTNGLMRHLRDYHGITVKGTLHKQKLLNMGYYHGYKGYRFVGSTSNRIPYTHFDEVVAIYEYDSFLKSLFYSKIMLIETALKNYTLEMLIKLGPIDFESIFINHLNDYKKHAVGSKDYHKKMKNRLDLRDKIYSSISYNFSDKQAVIQHFFHKKKQIPPSRLKEYIQHETNVGNILFNTIVDYLAIVVVLLKKLGCPRKELRKMLRLFVNGTETLRGKIPVPVYTSIIGSDFKKKTKALELFL